MKFHRAYLIKVVTAIVVIASFTSCVSTHTMKSSNIPTLPTGSPIKNIPSKTFAFKEFIDKRGNEPLVVGQWGAHKLVLDKPVADLIADAIKNELERNGHKCVSVSQQTKSDFFVEGIVYKYYPSQFGLASVKAIANVGVKLTISSMSSSNSVLVKNYEGEYPITGDYVITSKMREDALNQALLSVLRQIFYDNDLIEFMKQQ
jgi:uncharacterized lipoprotein YajG